MPMNPLELLQRTLGLIYDLVDRLASQKAVSEALSMTDGQISRLLGGTRKISLEETFDILAFLDVPPRLVIETVCEDEPVTAIQVLRAFRRGDGLCDREFLETVKARLPRSDRERRLTSLPSPHRKVLLELEEERFQNSPGVKARLERLIV